MNPILSKIKRGGEVLPPRTLLVGAEGIGKSTFAAGAPNPLFICSEQGLTGLEHVARFTPENYAALTQFVDQLIADPADYQTIVIDTIDWMEQSVCEHICENNGKKSISAFDFGKGYAMAEEEAGLLTKKLDVLRERHKIGIIYLAHAWIKNFSNPQGDSYDRWEMKGNKKFTAKFKEAVDTIAFATHEVFKQANRATQTERTMFGGRVMYTHAAAAWEAKNRYNLPEVIDLSYDAYLKAIAENQTPVIRKRYQDLLQDPNLPEDTRIKAQSWPLDQQSAENIRIAIKRLEVKIKEAIESKAKTPKK
jgi:hypothetical protein